MKRTTLYKIRLIHVQFLIQWYIAILFEYYLKLFHLNVSPIGLNFLEVRMNVPSPNWYDFKKPSVLAPAIRSSHYSAYFKTFS